MRVLRTKNCTEDVKSNTMGGGPGGRGWLEIYWSLDEFQQKFVDIFTRFPGDSQPISFLRNMASYVPLRPGVDKIIEDLEAKRLVYYRGENNSHVEVEEKLLWAAVEEMEKKDRFEVPNYYAKAMLDSVITQFVLYQKQVVGVFGLV